MKIPPADYNVVRQVVIDLGKDLLEAAGYLLACIVLLVGVLAVSIALTA